jgi:single-strand DNA-binding protein
MNSLNKAILIGRLGKDPEVRYLEGNVAKAAFPLATSETYKDKSGQKVENTNWHNIVCWRGLAEVAEKYLKKGANVYVEGKITTRSWDDKDGNKRYTTEVVAENFIMLDSKRSEDGGNRGGGSYEQAPPAPAASNENKSNNQAPATENYADDLPF